MGESKKTDTAMAERLRSYAKAILGIRETGDQEDLRITSMEGQGDLLLERYTRV